MRSGLILLALLLLFLGIWYITEMSPKQRSKRVRMFVRYIRNKGEIFVRIESFGKLPVDIQAPEIKFYSRTTSRSFTIISQERNLFPLSLFPLTDYKFKVNIDRFYDHDNSLRDYKKIKLIVREKTGRLLKARRVWL